MLKVGSFVNQLMTSNCYVVDEEETHRCIIIDPGSEKSEREIDYVVTNGLSLDYIILTHEHTDHNWGVNALKERFPEARLVCSELCNIYAKKAIRAYFLYYYDDPDYRYELLPADIIVSDEDEVLPWCGHKLRFFHTPGHSRGSMCIKIDDMLFSGDTLMPFKPYFNGRDSNEDDWHHSMLRLEKALPPSTMIYPGHGEHLFFGEWQEVYGHSKKKKDTLGKTKSFE